MICSAVLCVIAMASTADSADAVSVAPLRFSNFSSEALQQWQTQTRQKLATILKIDGARLSTPDLQSNVLSTTEKGTYTKREIELQAIPGKSTLVTVTIPKRTTQEPLPAVVCIPGHQGKREDVHDKTSIYKGFAQILAESGFVTASISVGQHEKQPTSGTLMGERLLELMTVVDYLTQMPEVNPERMGCAGLSLGGEMAMWLGAMDTRIHATLTSGFLTCMDQMEHNHCMCWKEEGLRDWVDFSDIYALIAPRLLLCQLGENEPPNQFPPSLGGNVFKELKKAYEVAGVPDNAKFVVHSGAHEVDLPSLITFFEKTLSNP
jgi:hypothetical protein